MKRLRRHFALLLFLVALPLMAQENSSLQQALNADGTLKVGQNGAFSAQGYAMQLGPNGEPIFSLNNAANSWDDRFQSDGVGTSVFAIAILGNDIYVGGAFTTAGGAAANRIARFNTLTQRWSALGSGVNLPVRSLAVSGTDLIVGGEFTQAGGNPANYVARYNTQTEVWSSLGTGVNGSVLGIAVSGNDLFVGGTFSQAGGNPASRVARFNTQTSTWSSLGSGTNDDVDALAISNNVLYVSGNFTQAGGNPANRVARFNVQTSVWSSLGTGTDGRVRAIIISGNDVFAGGSFTQAGGNAASNIARFNLQTSQWSALGGGISGFLSSVYSLATDAENNLYVGGFYSQAGSINIAGISRYNGQTQTWSTLQNLGGSEVFAVRVAGSNVYIGGSFTGLGASFPASRIARFDLASNTWNRLSGNGVNNVVRAIATIGNDIYVAGAFTFVGNVAANRIAKYNRLTNQWSALGNGISGPNPVVWALAVINTDLFVGGFFNTAGTLQVSNFARFNTLTEQWLAPNGTNGVIYTMAVANNDVIVGGQFTQVNGTQFPVSANNIASFNSQFGGWSAFGNGVTGINAAVNAIAVMYTTQSSGNGLVVGGRFTQAGTLPVSNIAILNTLSSGWGQPNTGVNGVVNAIVTTGNQGNEIYVGGDFTQAAGNPANRLALYRLNVNQWSEVGGGLANTVNALALSGNSLYVGGAFTDRGNRAAVYNLQSQQWSALGTGLNNIVTSILPVANEVFFGGTFTTAGGSASSNFARWFATPTASQPQAILGQVSNITSSTLTLNGAINPNGLPLTVAQFEYALNQNFSSGVQTLPTTPTASAIGSGVSLVSVSAVMPVQPNTTYYFRLRATNANGSVVSQAESFRPTLIPTAGLQLWLRADSLVTQSGGEVSQWNDLSGNNRHAIASSGTRPLRVTSSSVFNNRAVIDFGNTGNRFVGFQRVADMRTVVIVARTTASRTFQFLLGDSSVTHFHPTERGFIDNQFSLQNVRIGTIRLNRQPFNARDARRMSSPSLIMFETNGNAQASTLARDRTIDGRGWRGEMAEVIVYNRILTESERNQVETYLSQRYAIGPYVDASMATNVTSTGATFNGRVNPFGAAVSVSRFEYSLDSTFSTGVINANTTPNPAGIGNGTLPVSVSATVTGLQANSVYYYRLRATTSGGTSLSHVGVINNTVPSNGLQLWLRADTLITRNGTTLARWDDISENERHATSGGSSQPTVVTSSPLFAGRPVIDFGAAGNRDIGFRAITDIRTAIVVTRSSAPGVFQFLFGDSLTIDFHPSATNLIDNQFSSANLRNGEIFLNGQSFGGTAAPRPGTPTVVVYQTTGNVRASTLARDRTNTVGWRGEVAEVMIYNRELTTAERQSIQTYLNQRYIRPVVGIGPATAVSQTSATLNGTINPNRFALTAAQFQYSLDSTFVTGVQTANTTPAAAALGNGVEPIAVSATVSIQGNSRYFYRLRATSANGVVFSERATFTNTLPAPTATIAAPTGITSVSATLNGFINPNGNPLTLAQFEYSVDSTFTTGVTTVNTNPEAATIGSGAVPISVGAQIVIQPNSVYFFRLRASNQTSVGVSAVGRFQNLIPGGAQLWLRADSLVTSNGGFLTVWGDLSGNNRNATSAGTTQLSPSLQPLNTLYNDLPVINFSNVYGRSVLFPRMTDVRTAIAVARSIFPNAFQFLFGDNGTTFHFHPGNTNQLIDNINALAAVRNGSIYLNGQQFAATAALRPGTPTIIMYETSGNATMNSVGNDRNLPNRSWLGEVAEVIVYNRVLTLNERNHINGYLANRYAIVSNTSATPSIAANAVGSFVLGNTGVTVTFSVPSATAGTLSATVSNSAPSIVGTLPTGVTTLANRFWTINQTGLTAFTYSARFNLSAFGGIQNFNALKVLRRNNATSPWEDLETLQGVRVLRNDPVITVEGLTAFSDFAIGSDNQNVLSIEDERRVTSYDLMQNYPNPFNPSTRIAYQLPQSGMVSLEVYDALGRKVTELVNEHQRAGRYEVSFNAAQLSSGVYFYRLQSGSFTKTMKMMLVK